MIWTGIVIGGCGVLVALFHKERFDSACLKLSLDLRDRLLAVFAPPPSSAENDLALVSRIHSCLRAGISLDAALEQAAKDFPEGSFHQIRIQGILDGRPEGDTLSKFLSSALSSGIPLLQVLQNVERVLRSRHRLALKAQSMSAQARAQAEVLVWLPWALVVSLALIDLEWFRSAAKHPLAWILWAAAILLSGAGRHWLFSSLKKCLVPRTEEERMEEAALPELTLRILCELGLGRDTETAAEISLNSIRNEFLSRAFSSASTGSAGKILRLRNILSHCARTGAPAREELLGFLQDLQAENETRWEERTQRLPVVLLAPLFLCFFPSALLLLGGLLIPLLWNTI